MNKLREEMLEAYGKACSCCGETEIAFLTLEHIYRDGAEHRKQVSNILSDLKKRGWPTDRYTINCMNCNWVKRSGNNCPHDVSEDRKQYQEALEDQQQFYAYSNSCSVLGISPISERSESECKEIIEKGKKIFAILKNRSICDFNGCHKQSCWYAHLDDLVFCLSHKYEWQRKTTGY